MDKLRKYQDIVIGYLNEQAQIIPANLPDIESHVIVDRENNHFQLLQTGWQESKYIFTVVMHFDIKEEKVWFQRNITEHDAVDVLMERGVAKEDIVLGFRPPFARAYSGFATA
ncbi:MAG: XisI protein [Saprospiraceae bacterium]|nr:XisI protein [Saprospiraceae bacterium]MCF8251272.1 XisI protein [Saprospiraceae bacterium]MCF8280837.1 XisI protein [Bacteroidales bacterium]MCF8311809.1 XisI protein [Saprospiraceae bacterium]MCF8441950.1 XisI protein [Saprospiraceae bacterium]